MTYAIIHLEHLITYLKSISAPPGYIDSVQLAIRDFNELIESKKAVETSFDVIDAEKTRLKAAVRAADKLWPLVYADIRASSAGDFSAEALAAWRVYDAARTQEKQDEPAEVTIRRLRDEWI
jgi:hypothetical protein